MANGVINPFERKIGVIAAELAAEEEDKKRRLEELLRQQRREETQLQEDEARKQDEAEAALAAALNAPLGEAGIDIPQGPAVDPPPAATELAEKEALYRRATKAEKKKLDKARFKREQAEKDAIQRAAESKKNVEQTLLAAAAEDEIWAEIGKKHPPPSKAATLFGMATMGFGELLLGSPAKRRKYGETGAQAIKRYRELQKDDRTLRDAAKRARATGAGRAVAGVTSTDKANMGAIMNQVTSLDAYLPENWAEGVLTGSKSEGYKGQMDALRLGLFSSTGKRGKKAAAVNPNIPIKISALKQRLDTYKELRDAKQEDWKEAGATNMQLDGSLSEAFVTKMKAQHPDALKFAIQGTMSSKKVPVGDAHKRYITNRAAAREHMFNSFLLMGRSEEEAKAGENEAFATVEGKERWTGEAGMDYLKRARKALSEYHELTGTHHSFHGEHQIRIMELDARRKLLLADLDKAEGEDLDKLREEIVANKKERSRLHNEMFLIDPAEVETAVAVFKAEGTDRLSQSNILRNRALADIEDARENIGEELWAKHGGDDGFLETAILEKGKKVVKFDPEKHKDQEAYSFQRIIPNKRRDALAVRVEERVTAWGERGEPLTMARETKPALSQLVEGKKSLRMLTERDVKDIKAITSGKVDLRVGLDVSVEGRLLGEAREAVLAWMVSPDGREVTGAAPSNFNLFLKGFTPEYVDLVALGGDRGVDAGLKIWQGVQNVDEMNRMLTRIEAKKGGGVAPIVEPEVVAPIVEPKEAEVVARKIDDWTKVTSDAGGYDDFVEIALSDPGTMKAVQEALTKAEADAFIAIRDMNLPVGEQAPLVRKLLFNAVKRLALGQKR